MYESKFSMSQVSPNNYYVTDETLAIYLKNISKHRTLNTHEEAKTAQRIRKGDRSAFEKLVKCNLRFVVLVCRNYRNQGLPLSDLINEGNLGLMRAAKRFNEKKNFKFISYAVWWIRQAILQALAEQSRIIKLPLNRVSTIYRIGKAQNDLEQRFGRQPNSDEIASELNLKAKDVLEAMKIGNSHMSLDTPIGQDQEEDSKLIDLIHDEDQVLPDERALKSLLHHEIEDILSNLTDREKKVIKLYFGIGEDTSHTLEEIGGHFNLTRERIRQIKDKALRRLKSPMNMARLKAYAL
jgi:RNA polymerase primary sigma factor